MSDLTTLGGGRRRAPRAPEPPAPPASGSPADPLLPPRDLFTKLLLASVAGWSALAGLWILHVLQLLPTTFPGRLVLALTSVATCAWLLVLVQRELRRRPAQVLAALGLLLLAVSVRLTGITHELVEQAYLDEGTYLHHASEIDRGNWRRSSFVYPHLLYNLGAFGFWLAELTEPVSSEVTTRLIGGQPSSTASDGSPAVSAEEVLPPNFARNRLVLRVVVALLSAAATLPVAFLGLRLGGPLVALLAGALWIASPLVNEGSHLVISDWPAASFAAWCLAFVAQWYERPTRRIAVLAGVAAGLAAGAKYPGGVVALAIVAVWLSHQGFARGETTPGDRAPSLGLHRPLDLLLATSSSIAAFIAASPSFVLSPSHALFAPRGMLFGLRQYGGGGWLGVQPESNAVYYLSQLAADFGWIPLTLGTLGLLILVARRSPTRRRALWLAPYPIAYLVLLTSMSMVVKRNLAPVLPAVCAFLALGLFVVIARTVAFSQRWPLLRRRIPRGVIVTTLVGLLLAPATFTTLAQSVALARPSTRELASRQILTQLPPGVRLLKESYTPRLLGTDHLEIGQARFLARRPLRQLLTGRYDYLLAASSAYFRFVRDDAELEGHHLEMASRYRRIFAELPAVWRFTPDRWRAGPELRLYAVITAEHPETLSGAELVRSATLPDSTMQQANGIHYTRPGQWALLRLPMKRGTNLLRISGDLGEAAVRRDPEVVAPQVRVMSLTAPVALERAQRVSLEVDASGALATHIEAEEDGLYLAYLFLPRGCVVHEVGVRRPQQASVEQPGGGESG